MTTEPRPDLSIVVVTHNRRERTLATIRSAKANTGDVSAEWLVVDSGSTDGTPDAIAREWDDLRLFRRPNIGFAAANNVALRVARGRYVLLLNPDVDVVQGCLADLVRALDERPEVGAASVVLETDDGKLQPSIMRFPSGTRALGEALFLRRLPGLRRMQEFEVCPAQYRIERSADSLSGAFLIVRAAAIGAVGALDERFFLYSEEVDWCYRLRSAGWDIRHLPIMAVIHYGGVPGSPALAAQLSYSKLLFARKHLRRPTRATIRAALTLRHLLRAGLATTRGRRGTTARRREWAALLAVLGIRRPPYRATAA